MVSSYIMSTPIERYENAVIEWKQITRSIFGTSTGFDFRISPNEGKIYFSKKGIELIKANVFLVATSAQRGAKLNWIWAWHNTKYLKAIDDEHRITSDDIEQYEGTLGKYKKYFTKSRVSFNLRNSEDKNTLVLMRAIALDILDGNFIYEAESGSGKNIMQYTFVLSSVKKIKQQVPKEPRESEKKSDSESD